MAVKFSDFEQKQDASVDVTNMVGYLATGELNIMIPPGNLDTTYVVSTGNAGASPTINLQGTKPNQPSITPSTVSLTGSGATLLAGNGTTTIDFASTTYALTATDTSPAGTVPLVLTGTGGGDAGTDTVNLVGAGNVQLTATGNTITIEGTSADDINTILVTVVAVAAGNRYFIDGTQQQSLELVSGITYRLDQSATTPSPGNSGHPLRVSTTSDGTHGGGVEYTTGVIKVGTPGTAGAYTQIIPEQDTPKLYYYCEIHPNMGGEVIDPRAVVVTSVTPAANGTSSSGNPLTITPTSGAVTVASNAFAGAANVGHVPTAVAAASGAFLKQDGTWAVPPGGGGSGSVTSVALTMPSAFAVGGTPITSSGTLAVTPTGGSAGQFLNYLGAWATPASGAPTKTVDQVTISNATTGTVSLSVSPSSEAYTDMYVSGVYQNKSVYSLSGSTITLDSSAYFPNGSIVEVVSTT